LRAIQIVILVSFLGLSQVSAKGIELAEPVARRLNALLESTVEFHKSIFDQNEVAIGDSLDELLARVNEARAAISHLPAHDRQHLEVILNAIKSQLEQSQFSSGPARKEHVREAFYQHAHMTRIYQLDPKFQVFFCPQDRSHWVQAGRGSARNPINPETLEQCGKVVR
jgi:hypothetical protein